MIEGPLPIYDQNQTLQCSGPSYSIQSTLFTLSLMSDVVIVTTQLEKKNNNCESHATHY